MMHGEFTTETGCTVSVRPSGLASGLGDHVLLLKMAAANDPRWVEVALTDAEVDRLHAITGRDEDAVLRCGHCGRDLTTEHGHALHVVFRDGSMRCYDVDDTPILGGYVSTRAFLDSTARTDAVRALTEHGVTDDRFPGTTIYGKGGKDHG